MNIPIGSAIKYFRKEHKFTQKELGDCVGLSEKTISSYENHWNEPDLSILLAISQCFGLSLTDLICKAERMIGMRKEKFFIEYLDCVEYEGYTEATHGVYPLFPKETAMKIIQHINQIEGEGNARYDEEKDSFFIIDQGEGEWEEFEGYSILSEGESIRVYPIGSNHWLWEEVAKENQPN